MRGSCVASLHGFEEQHVIRSALMYWPVEGRRAPSMRDPHVRESRVDSRQPISDLGRSTELLNLNQKFMQVWTSIITSTLAI